MFNLCKRKVISTGPLENQNNTDTRTQTAWVKVLNNDRNNNTQVRIKVFRLNGTKEQIANVQFNVPPGSSTFRTFNVGNLVEFEVQIQLKNETDDVLVSVFGKMQTIILLRLTVCFIQNFLRLIDLISYR